MIKQCKKHASVLSWSISDLWIGVEEIILRKTTPVVDFNAHFFLGEDNAQ